MAAGRQPLSAALDLFAVAPPGLEEVVGDELAGLGVVPRVAPGGVGFRGTHTDLMRISLHTRTATRILVRVAAFNARTFHELERHGRRVPWERWLGTRAALLRVTCRKSKLYHQGAVAQRLHEAIAATTGRPSRDTAAADDIDAADAQLFVVRLYRDRCTISADASGARLHLRGYRQALAKAPLRENLAAALLRAAGWHGQAPLLDPLCGSGTIAIEAALLARRIAPGIAQADRAPRPHAFQAWPEFDAGAWDQIVDRAREAIRPEAPVPIHASDRTGGAIRAARANAERAGVAADITFTVRTLEALEPPADAGWVVTNPPYGRRVADAGRVRHTLERHARDALAGWTIAWLEHGRRPADDVVLATRNGGIPVQLRVRQPR